MVSRTRTRRRELHRGEVLRRYLTALVVSWAVVGVVVVPAPRAAASRPGIDGRFAYIADDPHTGIPSLNVSDARGDRQLTNDVGVASATFIPLEPFVVFGTDTLNVVSTDGGEPFVIAGGDDITQFDDLTWSPAGDLYSEVLRTGGPEW